MAIGDKTKSNKGLLTGSIRMCKFCGRDFNPLAYGSIDYTCPHCDQYNGHPGLRTRITEKGKNKLKETGE